MSSKNYETTQEILNPTNNSNLRFDPASVWRTWHPSQSFSSPVLETLFRLAALGLVLLSVASIARACGPDFPNNLLEGGDDALLVAPLANFTRELERLNLVSSRFDYVGTTNTYQEQTLDAEISDLTLSLKRNKVPGDEAARIIGAQCVNRRRLGDFLRTQERWEEMNRWRSSVGDTAGQAPPVPPVLDEVTGLPGEFADYFEGAVAYRNGEGNVEAARAAWERVLELPAAERKFKSTWAAYMLGKSWEGEDDDRAVGYYQRVRSLAKTGFADSTGLATASLGWEAKICYERGEYQKAIALYLEQLAAGDGSAAGSLRLTAAAALGDPEHLPELALNPNARQVITAYLVSSGNSSGSDSGDADGRGDELVVGWLSAIEAAKVKDVELAEKLALAAYQGGAFDEAQRWIKRSANSPLAQWLQAKLLLRQGKVAQAAALLAKVSQIFPLESSGTNAPERFTDNLYVLRDRPFELTPIGRQALGEWGVLQLSRRDFVEALDALLRGGFWHDAAYVAERVLNADELKAYVDRNWPAKVAETGAETNEVAAANAPVGEATREKLRYLLARRLTREFRSGEARGYYPAGWRSKFDELVTALDQGWNESVPVEQRVRGLFAAAFIARTNGMELLGTELAPDWFIHGGDFESGVTRESRVDCSARSRANVASEEELNRAARHHADPEARFHYRYQAAFLGWEAAKLMPDNADETARVLCTAGSWLKRRDPDTADIFYKALVRRCRKTAIGARADQMRWFPVLDENGQLSTYQSRLAAGPLPAPVGEAGDARETAIEFPVAGRAYIVHSGDSLGLIAQAAGVTVKQILESNPGLEPARLRVGQRIAVPERLDQLVPVEDQGQP